MKQKLLEMVQVTVPNQQVQSSKTKPREDRLVFLSLWGQREWEKLAREFLTAKWDTRPNIHRTSKLPFLHTDPFPLCIITLIFYILLRNNVIYYFKYPYGKKITMLTNHIPFSLFRCFAHLRDDRPCFKLIVGRIGMKC